jgi:GTP-binding protein
VPEPPVLRPRGHPQTVVRENGMLVVRGEQVERWVAMTDLDNDEALHLRRPRLRRAGLDRALRAAGARPGETVRIGSWSFTYEPASEAGR